MTIKDKMKDAVRNNNTVRIVDNDGIEYVGKAVGYHNAADEDRWVPTVCIRTKSGLLRGFYEDDIVSIEEV